MADGSEFDAKTLELFSAAKYWDEIEVCNFNEANRKEIWYVKLLPGAGGTGGGSGRDATDSYGLLITDQIRVWGRRSSAAQIEAERKEYAAAMKRTTIAKVIGLLEELLCRPSSAAHPDKSHQVMVEPTTDVLTLQSSMSIDVYPFKWQFECAPIGTAQEQAAVIRDQFIRPLQMMLAECVGSKLKPTASARRPAAAAAASAAASAAAGSGSGSGSFEPFSLEYQFRGELGALYRGAIERITQTAGAAAAAAAGSGSGGFAFSPLSLAITSLTDSAAAAAHADDAAAAARRAAALAAAPPPAAGAGRGGRADHKHGAGAAAVAAVAPAPAPAPEPAAPARPDVLAADGSVLETGAEVERREALQRKLDAQQKAAASKKRKKFV